MWLQKFFFICKTHTHTQRRYQYRYCFQYLCWNYIYIQYTSYTFNTVHVHCTVHADTNIDIVYSTFAEIMYSIYLKLSIRYMRIFIYRNCLHSTLAEILHTVRYILNLQYSTCGFSKIYIIYSTVSVLWCTVHILHMQLQKNSKLCRPFCRFIASTLYFILFSFFRSNTCHVRSGSCRTYLMVRIRIRENDHISVGFFWVG